MNNLIVTDNTVVMTMDTLVELLDRAQIRVVNDHIKPFDARKATRIIASIKSGNPVAKATCRTKRSTSSRELKVEVVRGRVEESPDYSKIKQYIVN